jgi:hypothetical protein
LFYDENVFLVISLQQIFGGQGMGTSAGNIIVGVIGQAAAGRAE